MTDTATDPWYVEQPERLKWELDEFTREGLDVEASYGGLGELIATTTLPFRSEALTITATFSEAHPFFSPTIASDRYILSRHQDPQGKNFCLLEDSESDWRPWYSAARLISGSLRRLLADFETGKAAVYAGEADMPEPVSAQLPYVAGRVVLVGAAFLEQNLLASSGTMTLIHGSGTLRVLSQASGIGQLEPRLMDQLWGPTRQSTSGRWVALASPPRPEEGAEGILEAIATVDGRALEKLQRRLSGQRRPRPVSTIVGLTFIEEGPTRDQERRTWCFADIEKSREGGTRLRLWQAQALTVAERQQRLAELEGLSKAHVVVVGAGSVGAPVALELAKAGVGRLTIFDRDSYDANNAVRHILPVDRAGQPKATAVADLCRGLNPFAIVTPHDDLLGHSADANAKFDNTLETAQVVIDTTGSQSVARFAERRTRRSKASLIVAGLTASSHGADVFTITTDGACFQCFAGAQEAEIIPKPAAGAGSAVTPIGCRHPAFSGAGFEATELAAIAARRVVEEVGTTSYPRSRSNWIVLNFRSSPHYQEGFLAARGDCESHP